ncbi:18583_t:CDS:2 [Dentiscutata erythropus]|uniref:18583_t:CDS:1 n=1 Tax=Dentiscutata erythropus TaxID=1348616 RepID=A0A9N9EJ15_9GLOM|nr:18583_t:CDS:2 [Dentiscutata erythropus]
MENPEQITILTRSSSLNVEINSQPDNPPTYEEAVANTSLRTSEEIEITQKVTSSDREDSWDNICEKVESWSTKSTGDKEDSFEATLPLVEFDNQFSVIDLKFYTRYEKYLDDVRREDPEKYEKFKMYFSFLDAHIHSYHNLFYDAIWYYSKAGAFDLLLWRRKQYEEDFEWSLLSFGHALHLESERKT